MKAISIKQPWAWLIVNGIKNIENRNWKSNYQGRLLIHASMSWDQVGYEYIINELNEEVPGKKYHHYGMILGVADLTEYVDHSTSKWFFGPWGLVLENAHPIHPPVKWKGQLGLFNVPDEIAEVIS